jgi:hypothetical protein
VSVSCFLLFLCFRSDTQEIFSELDETSSWSHIFPGSFQTSEGEMERGHQGPTHRAGVAWPLAAPPLCEGAWLHLWRRPFAYKDPPTEKTQGPNQISRTHRDPLPPSTRRSGGLIHLKHIYNFWCSMLFFTPFANCFVTLSGIFYAFSGTNLLTSATVPVSCFLLFLCFRSDTQEIFSELDETSS